MTTSAILFMGVVWAAILLATGYCFWKLLRSERMLGGDSDPSSGEASHGSHGDH